MSDEFRIEELLDVWEDAFEGDGEISPEELCRDEPHLLKSLQAKIVALKQMSRCFQAFEKESSAPRQIRIPKTILYNSKLLDLDLHERGGLGVVYRAKDEDLHREVAVKFLNQPVAKQHDFRQRFQQEAEITGRLDHPGVVPVYACGQSDDQQPFYVMRFIRGDTYDDAIKSFHKGKATLSKSDRQLARQKLLVQLASVCQTIAYAHNRGIVHRDIKPQNIMLGKYGETLVVDWGLAIPFQREGQFRVNDEKTLVPQSTNDSSGREGEGTPVYMSPEQAAGKEDLGPSSDIYSLGLVLYRVLTGKLAFDASSPMQIKVAIMKGDFIPPRKVDKSVPSELESICLKAMSLLPTNRYGTANEMAEDIENFLADVSVNAHHYSRREQIAGVIQQNQGLFTGFLIAALALLLASMIASISFYKTKQEAKNSLIEARISQVDSLDMSCRMSAKAIRYNLESRLFALEQLASSPDCRAMIAEEASPERRAKLKERIRLQFDSLNNRLPLAGLLLLDGQGVEIAAARSYMNDESPNQPGHRLRPYFYGGELLLDSPPVEPIHGPITEPFLGPAYYRKSVDVLLCSLSVPVWGDNNKVVGVLIMEIAMGQFAPLVEYESAMETSQDRFAALVETRGELEGVLLHHPELRGMQVSESKSIRVCDSVFEKVISVDCTETQPTTIADYVDPLDAKKNGLWNSVVLPIQIRTQDNRALRCGWYVMIQIRPMQVDRG